MTLEPTSEPVWPEDEAREEAEGHLEPSLVAEGEARELALHIRARLPDRLQGCVLKPQPGGFLPTADFDYYLITVPTTFATELGAQGITPRRLALEMTLKDASDAAPPRIPVARYMHPESEVTTEIRNVGKFAIDLGKAVKVMQAVWPAMPDVLTAKTGGSIDIKRVRARVLATGKSSRECGWLIADSEIAYDFNPSCIVQAPKGTQLSVEARLHVEVWKRFAVAFHKTYLIQATPMRYTLASSVSPDSLDQGSEVTLSSLLADLSYTLAEPAPPSEASPVHETNASASVHETNAYTSLLSTARVVDDGKLAVKHIAAAIEAAARDAVPALPQDEIADLAASGSGLLPTGVPLDRLRAATLGVYAVVCRRGHAKDSPLARPFVEPQGFCPECGAPMLDCCPACRSKISLHAGQPPRFCAGCGGPFPWITRPERFYRLENMLGREDMDGSTLLLLQDDLETLRTSSELDEDQQLEIWKRIRTRAPGLFSGPFLEVSRTLLTPYLLGGLGLPTGA